ADTVSICEVTFAPMLRNIGEQPYASAPEPITASSTTTGRRPERFTDTQKGRGVAHKPDAFVPKGPIGSLQPFSYPRKGYPSPANSFAPAPARVTFPSSVNRFTRRVSGFTAHRNKGTPSVLSY